MGLGGIARDSLADLTQLDDGNHSDDPAVRSASFVLSPSPQTAQDWLDDDEKLVVPDSYEEPTSAAASSRGSAQAATTPARSSSQTYSQFHYEGYSDYYAEDFSLYHFDPDDDSDTSSRNRNYKKNIFCCLFAPWIVTPTNLQQQSQPHQQTQCHVEQEQQSQPQLLPQHPEKIPQQSQEVEEEPQKQTIPQSPRECATAETKSQLLENSIHTNHESIEIKNDTVTVHTSSTLSAESSLVPSTKDLHINCTHTLLQKPGLTLDSNSNQTEPPSLEPTTPVLKSILLVKRYSFNGANNHPSLSSSLKSSHATNSNSLTCLPDKSKPLSTPISPTKRQMFPTNRSKHEFCKRESSEKDKRTVSFNPMARVLTVISRTDIPLSQKAKVWWQKCDYDDFKKTGRIISKAMECGGSEIWLTSDNAWGKVQQTRATEKKRNNVTTNSSSNSNPCHSIDDEYNQALKKYIGEDKKEEITDTDSDTANFGNKWWCKFGHSRRGLEHIASSSEGNARQESVLLSIQKVLEEQKRQRAARTKDPHKLRNVCLQYTRWARDLALAAGAADAEAVATNFHMEAKGRAHFFAKRLHHWDPVEDAGGGVARAIIQSQILDANTHSRTSNSIPTPISQEQVPHDRSEDSISKRAKGFIPGKSVEDNISASAMLSGMGTVIPRAAKA